jgi:integrase
MPYDDVPAFVAALCQRETVATLALEFAILTASRTGEVMGARWDEINITDQLWVIPAARMKSGRMHRKPLGIRTLEIITKMAAIRTTSDFVFPGQRPNKPLSHVAFQKVLARMQTPYSAHGFRSSFRDWAGDCTQFPREVCEAALAHSVGDAAEQSYRRLDALQKRRALMETWANWCDQKQPDNVIAFVRPAE